MTEQHTDVARREIPAGPRRRQIVLGSAAVAAGGAMAQIQLHEYAHAVVGVALSGSATVHGAMVEHPQLPAAEEALTAIAGPVFSVLLGVAVYVFSRSLPSGLVRALLTWLALAGLQGAFGYLMIAAVVPLGDTAVAFDAWGVPTVGYALAGAAGLAGMFLNAYLLAREITRSFSEPADVLAASVWAWLVATGVLLLVYTSVALLAGLDGQMLVATVIGPATALVFAPMATFFWTRTPHRHLPWAVRVGPAVVVAVVVTVVVLLHAVAPVRLGS